MGYFFPGDMYKLLIYLTPRSLRGGWAKPNDPNPFLWNLEKKLSRNITLNTEGSGNFLNK